MLLHVFSIYDSAVEVYHNPFFARALGEAERNFEQLAQDPQSNVSKHPHQFDLFYLGKYDDNAGKFELLSSPQHVKKANAYTASKIPSMVDTSALKGI